MQDLVAGVYMLCAAKMAVDAPHFLAMMSVSDPRPTERAVTTEFCHELLVQILPTAQKLIAERPQAFLDARKKRPR